MWIIYFSCAVASFSPQRAFSGLQKAMVCEWAFLQRVVLGISGFFEGVETAASGTFSLVFLEIKLLQPLDYGQVRLSKWAESLFQSPTKMLA